MPLMQRIALGFLLLSGVFLGGTNGALGQSLDEAIASALETHPNLEAAQASIMAARANVAGARAAYSPEVTFQSSLSTAERDARLPGGDSFEETSEPVSATLRAEQPLYTNGLRAISSRQAVLSLREQRLVFEDTALALASNVTQIYLSVIEAREGLITAIENERLLSEQVRAESERLRLGTGTETDVALVQARLARARSDVSRIQFNLQNVQANYELMTGLAAGDFSWPVIDSALPPNLEVAVLEAREASARLRLERVAAERTRLDVAAASRRYGPQISLSVEASTARDPSPAIERDDEVRASLSFSLPLFAGGRDTAERREAVARNQASLAAIATEDMALTQQVTALWYQLETARSDLLAIAAEIEANEAVLEGVERGRAAGLWAITDILDATERLNAARQSETSARSRELLAKYQLALITGRILLPDIY